MQLSTTSLVVAFFCTATVQSLTLRGLGSGHHTTKELKEDKFVTDPSANVKGINYHASALGCFNLYTANYSKNIPSIFTVNYLWWHADKLDLQEYSRKRVI